MKTEQGVVKGLMLSSLVGFVQAYWVDSKSCGSKGTSRRLFEGVEEAYSMADLAVKTMESDPKTKAFASLIFKDDQCITQAKGPLEQATKNKARSWSANSKDAIVIYCDESRLTRKPANDPQAYDPDNDRYMGFDLGDSPCIESKDTAAYTVNADHRNPQGYPVSIIQLCPWYLEQTGVPTMTNSLKGLKADDQRLENIRSAWELMLGANGRAEVDTFAVLPTTLLHELMHTTFVGSLTDPPNTSYTYWDNVRKFQSSNVCAVNPETLAFMGLGANLIDKGWTVNPDGSMKKAPGAPGTPKVPKAKRAVVAWVG